VRRYIPELRRVPQQYLAEPWEMPASVQKEAGCVIGVHYPRPIIDLRAAREDALQRYAAAAAPTAAP
jgi:deoxyribodipyrimidine photolyase